MMSDLMEKKELLYRDFYPKVSSYIGGKIKNRQDVEELTSEVFLKIYRNYEAFDATKASLSTWVYTITRNTIIDFFRKRHIHMEYTDEILSNESIKEQENRENALEALSIALKKLSAQKRDIIILHYFKALTLKNISQIIGMSYANIKILHKKALQELKIYINE